MTTERLVVVDDVRYAVLVKAGTGPRRARADELGRIARQRAPDSAPASTPR